MSTSSLVPTTVGSLDLDHLERTFGVFLIGYVVQMIGYGFTFFQTYVYYSRFPNDHWAIRLTAFLVFLIDSAISALVSQALYYFLVTLFPYTQGLTFATKTCLAEHALSVIVIFMIQMFYVYRIWTLTKNAIISGLISLVSVAGFGLGIAMTVDMVNNPEFAHLATSPVKAISSLHQGLVALSALTTFCVLCFYLNPSRNTSIAPLPDWYDKFVAYTFSRGAASTFVQFLYFITFITMPSEEIWIPFQLVASKLFVNGFISMLNSRETHHGKGINEEDVNAHQARPMSHFSPSVGPTGVRFNVLETKTPININVTRTIEHDAGRKMDFDYEDSQSLNEMEQEANPRKASMPA